MISGYLCAMAKSMQVAWIGTGMMGAPMAGHLLAAGHAVNVHSRTRAKAELLLASGARWCDTPAEAASGCDVAFSMVGTPAEVEAVHLGVTGTLRAADPPRILVDMSTSSPELAVRLDESARMAGSRACDAPVTGGDVGARNATLSIMVGGDEASCGLIAPLLGALGKTIVRHGEAGQGQRAKLVNQILIAATMVGMCEGLASARASGLDEQRVLESVGAGAAGSWALANLAPRVLKGNLEPGFMVDHFVKDLGLALAMCESQGIRLPGVELAQRLYRQLQADGHGRRGTQALVLAYPEGRREPRPLAANPDRG